MTPPSLRSTLHLGSRYFTFFVISPRLGCLFLMREVHSRGAEGAVLNAKFGDPGNSFRI